MQNKFKKYSQTGVGWSGLELRCVWCVSLSVKRRGLRKWNKYTKTTKLSSFKARRNKYCKQVSRERRKKCTVPNNKVHYGHICPGTGHKVNHKSVKHNPAQIMNEQLLFLNSIPSHKCTEQNVLHFDHIFKVWTSERMSEITIFITVQNQQ